MPLSDSYSNDWRAWRILGGAHIATKSYGKAVWAYTNAVMLGDEECFAPLGVVALATDRVDPVRNILPHLLILKQASRTDQYDRLSIVAVLTAYSLTTHQQEVFLKALQGVEIKDILLCDDVARTVSLACEEFGAKEVETICSKPKEAIGRGPHYRGQEEWMDEVICCARFGCH